MTRLNFVVQAKNIYIIIFSTRFDYYHFYKFNFLKRYHLLHTSLGSIWCTVRKKIGSLFFLLIFIIIIFFVTLFFYEIQIYNQSRSEWFRYVINSDNSWKCRLKQVLACWSRKEQIWLAVNRLKQVRVDWNM